MEDRWNSPSYKRSRSWFRTADAKWNGMSVFCWLSLSPPTAHSLQELGFFRERIVKLYLFFFKYDTTKYFLELWRMQYYSIGTQD